MDRIYLDTNIFIILAEGAGETTSLLYELVAQQPLDRDRFLCTCELSIAELIVHPHRTNNQRLLRLYDNWMVSGGPFAVAPIDKAMLWVTAAIRAQHGSIKLPDAIHLSAAIRLKCSHVLTADTGMPDKVEVMNRQWDEEVGPAVLKTIRPRPDVLRGIIEAYKPA